eukprot:TRINITY_DN24759_c0_g1_i1.p1 TRINITY_DN24759_c0_g1~~TRINITY_DN24759_c0_g1_i1.p1  ORF type:complete len:2476 (+),score=500.29 TRINITY_DN24759_c0_g1_i1:515-7429(+)
MAGEEEGFGVKMVRKFINNLTVEISDVSVSFSSPTLGLASNVELPSLHVLSTDEHFQEPSDGEAVNISGSAMYKVVRLRGFGVRMSEAGLSSLEGARYVIAPTGASLKLAHVPNEQRVFLQLDLGVGAQSEVTLLRSQVKRLLHAQSALEKEDARLRALVVAPEIEQTVLHLEDASKAEYGQLYRRHQLHERRLLQEGETSLSAEELSRLHLLEDALSIEALAAQRCSVQEALASRESQSGWLLSLLKDNFFCGGPSQSSIGVEELRDAAQFEAVEAPQNISAEVLLGEMALKLLDDSETDEAGSETLSVYLHKTQLTATVASGIDHRGRSSANFRLAGCLGGVEASHAGQDVIKICSQKLSRGDGLAGAAKFDIENKLETTCNVLGVLFHTSPMEVFFLPSMVPRLQKFFEPPDNIVRADTSPSTSKSDAALAEQEDVAKLLLGSNADRAKEYADAALERAPDKLKLDVCIAAPTVHMPVNSLGTVVVNLGQIQLLTTEPCAMTGIRLNADLTDTMLRVVTNKKEELDVLKPFPIQVRIRHDETPDALKADIKVLVGDMSLTAAPQAVQVLAAVPEVLEAMAPLKNEIEADEPVVKVSSKVDAKDTALALREAAEGSTALEVATRRAEELSQKRLQVNIAADLGCVSVLVTDTVAPVMKLSCRVLGEGIVVTHDSLLTGVDQSTRLDVANIALEAQVLNPRSRVWEPLLEPFHLGTTLTLASVPNSQSAVTTKVSCSAHKPLLVNAAPSTLQRLAGLVPVFTASLAPPVEAITEDTLARYRVVNLFDKPLMLEFISHCNSSLRKEVLPTGSEWVSLDELIIPNGATALTVQLAEGGSQHSLPLCLEQCGKAAVPGTRCVAEVLAPEPAYRLLLLAPPLRIHNQTDLPVELRFHVADDVLGSVVADTVHCDAALVGKQLPAYPVQSKLQDSVTSEAGGTPGTVLLPPNGLCAVPSDALVCDAGQLQATLSARPVRGSFDFCTAVQVGRGMASDALTCPAKPKRAVMLPVILGNRAAARISQDKGSASDIGGQGSHAKREHGTRQSGSNGNRLCVCGGAGSVAEPVEVRKALTQCESEAAGMICEADTHSQLVPEAIDVTTLALRPMLSLLNALPGELSIGYAAAQKVAAAVMPPVGLLTQRDWKEVSVPSMSCLNLYDLPTTIVQNGIDFRARLNDNVNVQWANAAHVAGKALSQAGRTVQVNAYQAPKGAAAGLVAEPLGQQRLRMSCPRYFVHRAELGDYTLQLQRQGAVLPSLDGLTLLPADCEGKNCELAMYPSQARDVAPALHSLVMPVTYSNVSWDTPWGSQLYCVQAEDMNRTSVLGASCKVLTLRPRLVLTNASSFDLEILAPDGSVLQLAAHQSCQQHWQGNDGKKAAKFQMRPAGVSTACWSTPIPCSDGAAGSTPFHVAGGAESCIPTIWSAIIAPQFGALSIQLNSGSELVAANRSLKVGVSMLVQPCDRSGSESQITVESGEEKPVGWANPFDSDFKRALDVIIDGQSYQISDARRKTRVTILEKQLVLSLSRLGERTILALDDDATLISENSEANSSSTVELDLKLGQLGVSLIDEKPQPQELFFLHLGTVRLNYFQNVDADSEQLNLVISEIQGVCQLPERTDGRSLGRPKRKGEQSAANMFIRERPAVVLANHAEGGAAFLDIFLRREATSSRDLVVPEAEVTIDKLDITIDHDWLDPLLSWADRAVPQESLDLGVGIQQVAKTAGKPVTAEGYRAPSLPQVLATERVKLSEVDLTVWCSLPLSSLDFLPSYARAMLTLISGSGNFTLDGAAVRLPAKELPSHRGSVEDYALAIGIDYASTLVGTVFSLLGKSSVLNAGAVPLALGGTAVSLVTDGVGTTLGQGTGMLNHLTFDKEYAERQREVREAKEISNAMDGLREAGRSLASGLEGTLDIVRKPIEGAREGGSRGFVKGVGRGIAGTVVKPVVGVGQAASDIIAGISSTAAPESEAKKRRRKRYRCRQPRLLFDQLGAIRPWNVLEAEVKHQLSPRILEGLQEVFLLASEGSDKVALLLFADKLLVASIKSDMVAMPKSCSLSSSDINPSSRASSSQDSLGIFGREFACALQPLQEVLEEPDEAFAHTVRGLRFADLRAAPYFQECDPSGNLQLVLEDKEGKCSVMPCAGSITGQVEAKLLEGLCAAASGKSDWSAFSSVLRAEHQADAGASFGQLVLEVFEVERRGQEKLHREWKTPFLPTDAELAWRWVDTTGRRHPKMEKGLSRDESSLRQRPPCELSSLFTALGDWTKDVNEATDEDGWTYSMAWNSSSWTTKPGFLDNLRRRRWLRSYS